MTMASESMKSGKYLGFFIAGGLVTAGGGSILAMGIIYAWMGSLFQNMGGGMPMPGLGIITFIGTGFIIGGVIAVIVGLALLGTGVSRKKEFLAAGGKSTHGFESGNYPAGRKYSPEAVFQPSMYGTISPPVQATPSTLHTCRSCGNAFPIENGAQFCPNCGAPTN
jgi:hypothetical protein